MQHRVAHSSRVRIFNIRLEIMDAFYEQPPIIRTLVAAVFVTSCAVYVQTSLFYYVFFDWQRIIFKIPPQIWRAVTPFLISGPKLGIIMDPYFRMHIFKVTSEIRLINVYLSLHIRQTA